MERPKKRRKTQAQIERRNTIIVAVWAGLFVGLVVGIIGGAIMTRHNVVAKDIQELKAEIRITVNEMKLEQIDLDKLSETIQGWQMEIDEVWLYYGTAQPMRTRAMASDEGRPSKGD